MAEFSNAQKLAAIVSEWSRPAIAQVISSKIGSIGWIKSIQGSVMSLGLVGSNYNIIEDLKPIIDPAVNAVIEPMLAEQLAKLPDSAIPKMARSILESASNNGGMTILDGLITLEQNDIDELRMLVERNLPCDSNDYKILRDE